jgi:hypothetical protein
MDLDARLLGAEVRDGTLYLDYAVHNRGDRPARVAAPRFPSGRPAFSTELGPGPVLVVRRQGEPATLAPGERRAETLELPVPIPPRHPSAPPPEGPAHEVGAVLLVLACEPGGTLELGPLPVRVLTTIALPPRGI